MNSAWLEIREAAEKVQKTVTVHGDWESEVAYQQVLERYFWKLNPQTIIHLCDEHKRVCAELDALKRAMKGMAEATQIVLGKEGVK